MAEEVEHIVLDTFEGGVAVGGLLLEGPNNKGGYEVDQCNVFLCPSPHVSIHFH